MIALLAGLALADPCARESVVARGLVVEPAAEVDAALELTLWIRKRRIDGIPSFYVHQARADWQWTVRSDTSVLARASVGDGDALCEGEVRGSFEAQLDAGEHPLHTTVTARKLDTCQVRVALIGTTPSIPQVHLTVHGPRPPGPSAPASGPIAVVSGQDLVVEVPACL